jgi:ribosome assembly protein 1
MPTWLTGPSIEDASSPLGLVKDLLVQAVMRAWLPLAEAALTMVAHHLPSPIAAAATRIPHLTRGATLTSGFQELMPAGALAQLERTHTALASSSMAPAAPVVVYIAKMVAVPAGALPLMPGEQPPRDSHAEEFLAFGRVFSGVVREGQRLQVLSAAYLPQRPDQQRCVTGKMRYETSHEINCRF